MYAYSRDVRTDRRRKKVGCLLTIELVHILVPKLKSTYLYNEVIE